MLNGEVELLTNGTFALQEYHFRYIKKPIEVSLVGGVSCELADHTHQEIVDMAVSMALEDMESQRYQSHLSELNKQE